jgi:hypothetical protein
MSVALIAVASVSVTACLSVSVGTGQPPGNINDPCENFARQCRDDCAPDGVKEMACYQDQSGQYRRVCDCEKPQVRHDEHPETRR